MKIDLVIMTPSKASVSGREFTPHRASPNVRKKKPQFNLKAELEGSFLLIFLSLAGLVFSFNIIFFKHHPMRVYQKEVTLIEKDQAPNKQTTNGYWNPTFKLQDDKGRTFSQSVGFEVYAAKKLGDKFPFSYREYDVTQKNEHLWLYALVPIVIGGISSFILLLTAWLITKAYLQVRYFK